MYILSTMIPKCNIGSVANPVDPDSPITSP